MFKADLLADFPHPAKSMYMLDKTLIFFPMSINFESIVLCLLPEGSGDQHIILFFSLSLIYISSELNYTIKTCNSWYECRTAGKSTTVLT